MSTSNAAPHSFTHIRCSTTLQASDPAKIAEEDLLDLNPGSAPAYRAEYSLSVQLLKEPRAERELERESGEEEREAPKGLSFFLDPNCVILSPLNRSTITTRKQSIAASAIAGAPKKVLIGAKYYRRTMF
jgi:hypothetical protein